MGELGESWEGGTIASSHVRVVSRAGRGKDRRAANQPATCPETAQLGLDAACTPCILPPMVARVVGNAPSLSHRSAPLIGMNVCHATTVHCFMRM